MLAQLTQSFFLLVPKSLRSLAAKNDNDTGEDTEMKISKGESKLIPFSFIFTTFIPILTVWNTQTQAYKYMHLIYV